MFFTYLNCWIVREAANVWRVVDFDIPDVFGSMSAACDYIRNRPACERDIDFLHGATA